MRLSRHLSLTIAMLLQAGSALGVEMKLPVPVLETLPNGLEVAWFVNQSLPVTDLVLLMRSGFRDDPQGKSGTAEFVSELLDRGSAGMGAQAFARAVESLGASRSASAGDDNFTVAMHGLSTDAPVLMDLLSKMALKPDFPESEFEKTRARILDRWNHLSDSGETLASVLYSRLVATGTDYGRGGFTSAKEFQKITRADVLSFYKTHFSPKNAILMIVGRVNQVEMKKQIEAAFGAWTGEAPARVWKPFRDSRLKGQPGVVHLIDRPGLSQAQVRIGFKAPDLKSPDHYALTVANTLLGEYFGSRLNSVIRDKLGLTYSISSGFSYSRGLATFYVSSATRNEAVGPLLKKTLEILKSTREGPISSEEVKTAQEYLVGGFPLGVSTLGAVASRWLSGYVFDLSPTYLNEFVPKVTAVTREEIQAALAKHMDLDHLTIVVAGDGREVRKSLEAGKYRVVTHTAKDLL